MRSFLRLISPLALLCVSLTWCSCDRKVATPSGSPTLATAGGEVLTVADFQKEAERRLAKNLPVPEKAVLIDDMLGRMAALARAKEAKLQTDPETKREMENILIGKLRAQELETLLNNLTVTEQELQAAYAAGTEKFSRPAKVRLALLHLTGDPKMSEGKRAELRTQMEEGLKKAAAAPTTGGRGGAAMGFGTVAVDYSDDQVSRYRGGDIGWLDAGVFSYRWPKAVLEAGYALEKGATSGIIETDNGVFVVMKTDFRDGATSSFAEAKTALSRDLLAKKRADTEAAFLAANRTLSHAQIKADVLATVTIPTTPAKHVPTGAEPPPALPGMVTGAPSDH